MRRFVVACVAGAATLFSGSGAQAQTWSSPFWTAPTIVDWTGFYIGGQGTYQWSGVDVRFNPAELGVGNGVNIDTDGWMGGVHGGVQQQFGSTSNGAMVVGVDLSGDWGESEGTIRRTFLVQGQPASTKVSASIDEIFTAMARLGYATGQTHFYIKGGYASANVSTSWDSELCNGDCVTIRRPTSKNYQGWGLGAGAEWMFAQNWGLGLDYTYINLGPEDFLYAAGCCQQRVEVDPDDIHKLSLRLTLHFASPPPAVPVYK